MATLFNATEPGQLRGPQFDLAWCDELAKWRYARETWDMLQFALRLGDCPRVLVTTTPRPIELVKAILAGDEGRVVISRGSTMDNAGNLADTFLDRIKKRYAGTRLGRQELLGEVLGDLPGALWRQSTLDTYRVKNAPDLKRVVVSIDHAVTDGEASNEHGIVVAGVDEDQQGYVLDDGSLSGSPAEWAEKVIHLSQVYKADGVVVEVNQGGDLVAHTLRALSPNLNIIEVRATRGKHVRAEPISALYEKGRVAHVGNFDELEQQMGQMTTSGFQGEGSPDRVDALVWALTELFPDMIEDVPDASALLSFGRGKGWLST